MSTSAVRADASTSLARLGDELSRCGYGEFVTCFRPSEPRPALWRGLRPCAPERLRGVIDLFLLGETVDEEALPEPLRELLPGLQAAGLIVDHPSRRVSTRGLVLLRLFGHWLLCDPPQANPTLYFGDDSVALLSRLAPPTGGDCLDLCCGPGVHALHFARFGNRVAAVDVDPRAAALAGLNSCLNRLDDRIEATQGDLFGPVAGRRFDAISVNPPMLPYPENLQAPTIGHGGSDGLETVWRILAEVPRALRGTGSLQAIAMTLGDGSSFATERLREVARDRGLDIVVSTIAHTRLLPTSQYFELLVETVAQIASVPVDEVREAYVQLLERAGASHLCSFFLEVTLGRGDVAVIDMAQAGGVGPWYV